MNTNRRLRSSTKNKERTIKRKLEIRMERSKNWRLISRDSEN